MSRMKAVFFCILLLFAFGQGWAQTSFEESLVTRHNVMAKERKPLGDVCVVCHTDGRVRARMVRVAGTASAAPEGGTPPAKEGEAAPSPVKGETPKWDPNSQLAPFSLNGTGYPLNRIGRNQPFGSSSSCLSCHDGVLGTDVHGINVGNARIGADVSVDPTLLSRVDHPISVSYPRRPDGVFVIERPVVNQVRFWPIPDLTDVYTFPTATTSEYFAMPADPQDFGAAARLVRTTAGVVHCDSCHNPHSDFYPPFLRASPRTLCLVCHDR